MDNTTEKDGNKETEENEMHISPIVTESLAISAMVYPILTSLDANKLITTPKTKCIYDVQSFLMTGKH